MEVKVSVAVAIYNVKNEYLVQCIESILGQTLKEIEIILISDNSCKENIELIHKYANIDSRIRIVENTENRGLAGVRNQSIDLARGEYLCFVDNDDWIEADMCEKAYFHAERYDAEVVCWSYTTSTDGINEKTNYWGPKEKLYIGDDNEKLQIQVLDPTYSKEQQIPMFVTAWAKLYSIYFLKQNKDIRFPENFMTGGEDYVFNYRIFGKTSRVYFFEYYGYYYRQFNISFTKSFRENEWDNRTRYMKAISQYIDYTKEQQKNVFMRYCLNQFIIQCIVTYNHPNCTYNFRQILSHIKKIRYQEEIVCALKNLDKLDFSKKKRSFLIVFKYKNFVLLYLLIKLVNMKGY